MALGVVRLAVAVALVAGASEEGFARKAQLMAMDGYPKPSCMCRTTFEGSVEEVLEALLDGESHRDWVSRLEESVLVAPRTSSVADAPVEQLVYYRFALPFPAWDRQVSAALFCDRDGPDRARVELRRVSLPEAALPPQARAGDFAGAPLPETPARDEAEAEDGRRCSGGGGGLVARGLDAGGAGRRAVASFLSARAVAGLDRAMALAHPGLRKRLARLRPAGAAPMSATLEEELHSRENCVTLPAFRVTYLVAAAEGGPEGGPPRCDVELRLGADPGIACPPFLLKWGLCHADLTLEKLQGQLEERRARRLEAAERASPSKPRDWPLAVDARPFVLASRAAQRTVQSRVSRLLGGLQKRLPAPPGLLAPRRKACGGAPFPVTPANRPRVAGCSTFGTYLF